MSSLDHTLPLSGHLGVLCHSPAGGALLQVGGHRGLVEVLLDLPPCPELDPQGIHQASRPVLHQSYPGTQVLDLQLGKVLWGWGVLCHVDVGE